MEGKGKGRVCVCEEEVEVDQRWRKAWRERLILCFLRVLS